MPRRLLGRRAKRIDVKEGASEVSVLSASPVDGGARRRARRGLGVYFAVLLVLSAVFMSLLIVTENPVYGAVALFSPAFASVVARLVLREGFADVSFRLGGRRGRNAILLAMILPTLIGVVAYGAAWGAGLAGFDPASAGGPVVGLAGDSASPVAVFALQVVFATFITGFVLSVVAVGEELGWRGYMLTRMIDAGVPRPVLSTSLIWAVWHLPVVFGVGYAAGPSAVLSAVLLVAGITAAGFVISRLRLETGSLWPAVVFHGVWNSVIQTAFDPATPGAAARLWVGESGLLVVLVLVTAAALLSRGTWTINRTPPKRGGTPVPPAIQPETAG